MDAMKPREPVGRIHPVAHGPKASKDADRKTVEGPRPPAPSEPALDDAYDDVPCTD